MIFLNNAIYNAIITAMNMKFDNKNCYKVFRKKCKYVPLKFTFSVTKKKNNETVLI